MKKTKHLTLCALMAAISIIALWLGTITQVFDITVVVFCALIIFIVYEELKYKALLVYTVTAVLAFALISKKEVGVEYVIFAIYPVLKPIFDKAGKGIRLLIKSLFFVLCSLTLTSLFRYVFLTGDAWYWDLIFFVGLILCYFLYDIVLKRFKLYYHLYLRRKLKIDRFFH